MPICGTSECSPRQCTWHGCARSADALRATTATLLGSYTTLFLGRTPRTSNGPESTRSRNPFSMLALSFHSQHSPTYTTSILCPRNCGRRTGRLMLPWTSSIAPRHSQETATARSIFSDCMKRSSRLLWLRLPHPRNVEEEESREQESALRPDAQGGALCHLFRLQHFAHFSRQRRLGEGFLNEGGSAVESGEPRDRVLGVAGHKEHSQIRARRSVGSGNPAGD